MTTSVAPDRRTECRARIGAQLTGRVIEDRDNRVDRFPDAIPALEADPGVHRGRRRHPRELLAIDRDGAGGFADSDDAAKQSPLAISLGPRDADDLARPDGEGHRAEALTC